jgi:hypothetical protein
MINREIYEKNDRKYANKDPDNKWYYYADITEELTFNNTSAVSCIAVPHRMTVIKAPVIHYDSQTGKTIITWMVSGPTAAESPDDEDGHVTLRVTCENEEQFDVTLYYLPLEN